VSRTLLSRIALDAGDAGVAVSEAQSAALSLAQHLPLLPMARATLAAALLRAERREEALVEIEAAMAPIESGSGIEDGEAYARLVYFDVLTAMGEQQRALAAILAARDRLLERAAKFSNPAWRESFLTRVPDNVRTMHLAERNGRDAGEAHPYRS
jgi:hypothetical protein